ncbi:MAG TPA: DUF1295 domain-containing protein [Methylophilus sp.]|nr:DUF1295 domain-containing protein [Methylophilus sp.]
MSIMAIVGWAYSRRIHNVTVVDSLWALFFLLLTVVNASLLEHLSMRSILVLVLVTLWALRLSGYLHMRNHGRPEDKRYAAIRARNQPNFELKSLYLVFLLQALLAWIIAMPLHTSLHSSVPLNNLDWLGAALWLIGMCFQVVGDAQLVCFKQKIENKNSVMQHGLWRYTRHPNYFGEACIWWGYYCIAASSGAAWTIYSPILMTFLLVHVTGKKLLEADIAERRPGYSEYIQRTSGFIPWFPKN